MNGITAQVSPGAYTLSAIVNTYNSALQSSLEKLATGLRVNSPSEDITAYFRGKKLSNLADASGTVANGITDHVSRLKTAEDALTSINDILTKMASKAKEATTETDDTIRGELGAEYDQMASSITTIVNTTRYDGQLLLNGSLDANSTVGGTKGVGIKVQVGADVNDIYSYQILDTRVGTDGTLGTDTFKGLNLSFASAETTWGAVGGAAAATSSYNEIAVGNSGEERLRRNLSNIDTSLAVLNGAKTNLQNAQSNYQAASSALVGVDQAAESSKYTSLQIQQQAAASFLAQSNISYGNVISILTGFSHR